MYRATPRRTQYDAAFISNALPGFFDPQAKSAPSSVVNVVPENTQHFDDFVEVTGYHLVKSGKKIVFGDTNLHGSEKLTIRQTVVLLLS